MRLVFSVAFYSNILLLGSTHYSNAFLHSKNVANRSLRIKLPRLQAATLTEDSVEELQSYFSIDVSNTGPSDGPVHTLTIHTLPGLELEEEETDDEEKSSSDDDVVAATTSEDQETEGTVNGEAAKDESQNDATTKEEEKTEEETQFVKHGPIIIETGKIGRQAAGAVTLARGDTVLYATAARDEAPALHLDFLPLSIEHQERFSAVGSTSGSYNRRDGRPAEHEILTCRLIDRPLRPLIANGWRHDTQILSWVLSYDGLRSCDPLAIVASAAALYLSDVPLTKPVAAAMVGYNKETKQFILNPTNTQMETISGLHLTIAGTKDAVLMIEGAADFLPESVMIEAVQFGHKAIKVICEAIEAFGESVGIVKKFDTIKPRVEGLQERVDELMTDRIDAMYEQGGTKTTQGPIMDELKAFVVEQLEEEFPDETLEIKSAFKDLLCRRMYQRAKATGLRCDGRKLDEIRRLDMEAGLFRKTHGSALFTRGETQALATATLGGSRMKQKIDKIDGVEEKRFYLQYTFPPSCVGETGRVGAPSRREVGHGNLAERALVPTLPTEENFPYAIRVESLVTESHGSSSMASVCGGSLALMDAGVPIKSPVAGIAMGMLLDDKDGVSDENSVILSDILGTEDALGTMDFKVAGDRNGITTFQLDIKCEGLSLETMQRALEQARVGRLHILDEMDKVLDKPRPELPPTVPKISVFSIPPESKGKIIGPGGKQVRAIIEDFGLSSLDAEDDGTISMTAFDGKKMNEAKEFIMKLAGGGGGGGGGGVSDHGTYAGPPPEIGKNYNGKITGIHPFGVFLEILPGAEDGSYPALEGLCHVSELAQVHVRSCEGFIRGMNAEELEVKYLGVNNKGKHQLSRKAVLDEKSGVWKGLPESSLKQLEEAKAKKAKEEEPLPMSDAEIDMIAQAIDSVNEL